MRRKMGYLRKIIQNRFLVSAATGCKFFIEAAGFISAAEFQSAAKNAHESFLIRQFLKFLINMPDTPCYITAFSRKIFFSVCC